MRAVAVIFRCSRCQNRIESREWTIFCKDCDVPMRQTANVWIRI